MHTALCIATQPSAAAHAPGPLAQAPHFGLQPIQPIPGGCGPRQSRVLLQAPAALALLSRAARRPGAVHAALALQRARGVAARREVGGAALQSRRGVLGPAMAPRARPSFERPRPRPVLRPARRRPAWAPCHPLQAWAGGSPPGGAAALRGRPPAPGGWGLACRLWPLPRLNWPAVSSPPARPLPARLRQPPGLRSASAAAAAGPASVRRAGLCLPPPQPVTKSRRNTGPAEPCCRPARWRWLCWRGPGPGCRRRGWCGLPPRQGLVAPAGLPRPVACLRRGWGLRVPTPLLARPAGWGPAAPLPAGPLPSLAPSPALTWGSLGVGRALLLRVALLLRAPAGVPPAWLCLGWVGGEVSRLSAPGGCPAKLCRTQSWLQSEGGRQLGPR